MYSHLTNKGERKREKAREHERKREREKERERDREREREKEKEREREKEIERERKNMPLLESPCSVHYIILYSTGTERSTATSSLLFTMTREWRAWRSVYCIK